MFLAVGINRGHGNGPFPFLLSRKSMFQREMMVTYLNSGLVLNDGLVPNCTRTFLFLGVGLIDANEVVAPS
jgi:hypothetical protein